MDINRNHHNYDDDDHYYYYHKYGDYYVRVKRRSRFLGRDSVRKRRRGHSKGKSDQAPPPA